MTLFAVSDVVYQALIGAVVTIVLGWMSNRTRVAVVDTAKDAAKEVKEVKATLQDATAVHLENADRLEKKVDQSIKQTNGMKDELVAAVKSAANKDGFDAGVKSEIDKEKPPQSFF